MESLNLEPDKSHSYGPADMLRDACVPVSWDRCYTGQRLEDGTCEVWVEELSVRTIGDAAVSESSRRKLPLHLEVRNHSPTGFGWGYGGSGPAQLALALLVDALGDSEVAGAYYQDFKREIVAGWPESWQITAKAIRDFIGRQQPNSSSCTSGE